MFDKQSSDKLTVEVKKNDSTTQLSDKCEENVINIRKKFSDCFDLVVRESEFMNRKVAYILLDGMCNELYVTQSIIIPLSAKRNEAKRNVFDSAYFCSFMGTGRKEIVTLEDAQSDIINGNVVMFVDGENRAISFSAQGFVKKSVEEPQTEQQVKGSHEGFTDSFKDNVTLLRRRLKTPELKIKKLTVGMTGDTVICLCYIDSRVSRQLLSAIETNLANVKIDVVHGAGALEPFLNRGNKSIFSATETTERPDILAAKLAEGRIGIIVDGSPYVIVAPYLFLDHFHSLDDYLGTPFYAAFIRALKMICFIGAVFLPAFYVAVCEFHPELLPEDVLFDIALSETKTPFPLLVEAVVIHLIYELVREAGLQMPKMVGHAVSIVGGLVVGDAAVTAGLIGAPMLIVVGLTAITSAVLSSIHESVAVLRFVFILIGGIFGIYGIILGAGVMMINICSLSPFGIPYSAPLAPFIPEAQRDTVLRASWKKLGKRQMTVKGMKY